MSLRLNNLLALFILGCLLLRKRPLLFPFNRSFLWGIASLTLVFLISLSGSGFKERSLVFFCWWGVTLLGYVLLPYFLLFYLEPKRVFSLYFLSFFCVGAYATLQFLCAPLGFCDPFAGQMISTQLVRPNAFAYEPSYYVLYMTPFVVIINTLYLLKDRRISGKFAFVVNGFYFISTATSALFGVAIYICLILFLCSFPGIRRAFPSLTRRIGKFLGYFVGCLVLLGIVFPQFTKKFFFKFFSLDFVNHWSFWERWVGIVNGWQLFLNSPLRGIGLGAFPPYLFNAWQERDGHFLFLAQDQLLPYASNPLKLFEPSNAFTELLASVGILGLLAFCVLLGGYLRTVIEAFKRLEGEKRKWIFALLLSVCVTLVVLQFNQGLFRTYVWTHFALSYALTIRWSKRAHLRESEE